MMLRLTVCVLFVACVSCGSATTAGPESTAGTETTAGMETTSPQTDHPAQASQFNQPAGPRVSTSTGTEGGVVVLWPRVIPDDGAAALQEQASALQTRLGEIAKRVFAEDSIDVRPEPQRVCPRAGCVGMSLGALLLHDRGGCAILALVSAAGTRPARIVPWAARVQVLKKFVPFREPPEAHVRVLDMVPCADILGALDEREPDVQKALQAATDHN